MDTKFLARLCIYCALAVGSVGLFKIYRFYSTISTGENPCLQTDTDFCLYGRIGTDNFREISASTYWKYHFDTAVFKPYDEVCLVDAATTDCVPR